MNSYFKFLSRNRLYTAIEFFGLAVSLAFVILIGSYVAQQYSLAHEGPDWKRIYAPGTADYASLSFWDKEELDMAVPEIEASTRVVLMYQPVVSDAGESYTCSGLQIDPDFFEVFPKYKLRGGSIDAFEAVDAVLISETFAAQLSKDGVPVEGKVIKVDGNDKVVAGVVEDFRNTLFPYSDVLVNIKSDGFSKNPKNFQSIGNYSTFYRTVKGAERKDVDAKVMELLHRNYGPDWGELEGWRTYRIDEIFLGNKAIGNTRAGDGKMLRLLSIVVLLLLLSAIFNYMNLSYALSGKRAKEMATRRLIGASKAGITWRYIAESVLFTAASFAVALLLARNLVPMMNHLLLPQEGFQTVITQTMVPLEFKMTPGYVAVYVLAILLLGAICGLLPAWTASRYEPINITNGSFRRMNKMVFGKVLIVAQNVLAVFLLSMAIVMEVQMKHMADRPTNSAVDNRFTIGTIARRTSEISPLIDRLKNLPFVERVGVGRGLPGSINMFYTTESVSGNQATFAPILCDSVYFRLLGLKVKEDFGHPVNNSIWFGESAYAAAEVSDTSASFARRFNMNMLQPEYIGGIVTDFPALPASDARGGGNTVVVVARPEELLYSSNLLIETTGEDKAYAKRMMQEYEDFYMEKTGTVQSSWIHGFLRDIFREQLAPVRRTVRLVELFTVLSVIIALLGLLAISTYYAEESTRQIAIRKVFGGDVKGETIRNVKNYMVLVGVACAIGIPVAVWASRLYLARFAYRIENYGWVFPLAILLTAAMAFGSVVWQTYKAAKTNPADCLKRE